MPGDSKVPERARPGRPVRMLALHTHPVQYYSPLLRTLAARRTEVDLEVLYITRPTAEQQGQGFGVAFEWDQDLLTDCRTRFFREPLPGDDYSRWSGLDAPGIGVAIRDARPDVVLLPGWNCRGLVRALLACNSLGIPTIYRGDTNLWQRPSGLRGLLWGAKNRLLLRRFSAFGAVGKRARLFLREHGVPVERIVASPHAVDGNRIRSDAAGALAPEGRMAVRRALGVRDEEFMVLIAGKLEERKRPDDAVRAVAGLSGPAVLVVCGTGEAEERLRSLAGHTGTRVLWLGFRNQGEMPRILAAADTLVVASGSETWGLVVNEAMAVGTPCVVSDAVGCAPDLIDPGVTGEVFPAGIVASLVEALERVRRLSGANRALSARALARESAYSLDAAADGLVQLAALAGPRLDVSQKRHSVLALCEGMAFLGGMERTTMEILDFVAAGEAQAHCIVNRQSWFRWQIVHRVEQGGHGWSGARATTALFSGTRSPLWALGVAKDLVSCSRETLAQWFRRRPCTVFATTFTSVIRSWPALATLRILGVRIILRSGAAPTPNPKHRFLWKWLIDSVVSDHVAISCFIAKEVAAKGVAAKKIRLIRNPLPQWDRPPGAKSERPSRVIYVGQVIPGKGIMQLLEALILLQGRGVPFEAALVGHFDGWEHPSHSGYKEAIRRKIAELPPGCVQVLGVREDVLDLMAASSLHCCPSQERLREGLGQVVLEAKAAGIPSVVTPSGALPEMIRHGIDGWVCRGFDAEAIAEGLAHFLLSPQSCRRAGEAAASWRDAAYLRSTVEHQWRTLLCGPGPTRNRPNV